MKRAAAIIISSVLLTACSQTPSEKQVADVIEKNPEIIFKAIEKSPEKFLEVLSKVTERARELEAKKREQAELDEFEKRMDNPFTPAIDKNVAYLGTKDAPLTLVEYSDFQCPFCARANTTVKSLLKKYKGKIRFIYKHLPLSFHPQAQIAAQYFEAIKLQNMELAFKFHDKVYFNQGRLKEGERYLKSAAKELGVNMKLLAKQITAKEVLSKIKKDADEAEKFGFRGTPGFLLNGVPIKGAYPLEHFEMIITKLQGKGKLSI
ncbi:MAG: thioredoxin domain-containing protein [Bacteriovoracaceae bacterium]|jgi:protein-disulfide isomerase|nr:thioredoxin domain-containing protein [Bacteriovoracaceae bacterium]